MTTTALDPAKLETLITSALKINWLKMWTDIKSHNLAGEISDVETLTMLMTPFFPQEAGEALVAEEILGPVALFVIAKAAPAPPATPANASQISEGQ